MSEHTPGPWKVTEPWNVVRTSADRVVAEAAYIGDTDTEKANTRLIAAAPDLLAALKQLVDRTSPVMFSEWLDIAQAAIAKAEGR